MQYIISLLCACLMGANDKNIIREESEYSYCDSSLGKTIYVQTMTLTNSSQEDYYTWIIDDNYTRKWGVSDEKIINWYFSRYVGDYSFMALMTDNVFFPNGFIPSIGSSFIKKLSSGERFTYSVLYEEQPDLALNKRIACYPSHIIDKLLGFSIDDFFLFHGESLSIPRKALSNSVIRLQE